MERIVFNAGQCIVLVAYLQFGQVVQGHTCQMFVSLLWGGGGGGGGGGVCMCVRVYVLDSGCSSGESFTVADIIMQMARNLSGEGDTLTVWVGIKCRRSFVDSQSHMEKSESIVLSGFSCQL